MLPPSALEPYLSAKAAAFRCKSKSKSFLQALQEADAAAHGLQATNPVPWQSGNHAGSPSARTRSTRRHPRTASATDVAESPAVSAVPAPPAAGARTRRAAATSLSAARGALAVEASALSSAEASQSEEAADPVAGSVPTEEAVATPAVAPQGTPPTPGVRLSAKGGDEGSSAKAEDGVELSAYERRRLENMRQNAALMAQLNLPSLAEELRPSPKSKPAKRGLTTQREKPEPLPRRKSARLQGLDSDGNPAELQSSPSWAEVRAWVREGACESVRACEGVCALEPGRRERETARKIKRKGGLRACVDFCFWGAGTSLGTARAGAPDRGFLCPCWPLGSGSQGGPRG